MNKVYRFKPTEGWLLDEDYFAKFDMAFYDKMEFLETFIGLIINTDWNNETKMYMLKNLTAFEDCDYFTIEELELI